MPAMKRHKTPYPGVTFVVGTNPATGKSEKIFYVRYRRDGKMVEEKAGRQHKDDMTAAKAAQLRARRMQGDESSNKEKREAAQAEKEKPTISRLWELYKVNKPNLKGLTSDENRFQNHINPAFGKKQPAEIVTLDVDRLRLSLLKTHQPATVKNVLELLRRIINFGVKRGHCPPLDPSRLHFDMPKLDNERTEQLTPDQLTALLKAMDEDPHITAANMMRMALYTGMRRGELFRLQWKDVDFERGFIFIKESKGGKAAHIPMPGPARELLQSIPQTDSPYVFPGRNGKQRVCIKTPLARIRDNAGLPKDFRPMHGLRHAWASMLASSGKVDLYTLQKLLTHKSPLMTQRYAHLADEAMQRAANVTSDIFRQEPEQEAEAKKVVNIKGKGK